MPDRFDEINIGDEAEIVHTVTQQDLGSFVELTGDDNPVHVDQAFAASTNLGKPVAHGMLVASFISTVIGTRLPGKGALWFEQHLRFLAPVAVGTQITVRAKVKSKSVSQRILVIETTVDDANGRRVIEGEAKVKVVEQRPIPAPRGEKNTMSGPSKEAIIVSGAGRGIGAEIARELARNGHPVAVNYRSDGAGAQSVADEINSAGGRAVAVAADVSDAKAVGELVEAAARLGPIGGIVCNASPPADAKGFLELDWPAFQHHLDVQIKGAVNLAQAVLPRLLDRGEGTIVAVSSIYAEDMPPIKLAPYVTAKAALNALIRSLAVEFGPKGIVANCVSPGMTHTDLIANVPEKTKMVTKMQTPLRRLADTQDIAGVVAFLFDSRARHITGQNIRVCGGIVMG